MFVLIKFFFQVYKSAEWPLILGKSKKKGSQFYFPLSLSLSAPFYPLKVGRLRIFQKLQRIFVPSYL